MPGVGVRHAPCNAHYLREFQVLTEIAGEDQGCPMQRLLWKAGAEGFVLEPGLIALFGQRYDRLVADALEYREGLELLRSARTVRKGRKKGSPGHNLVLRFRNFNTETLRNVLSTARKPGRNRIEALTQGPAVALDGLRR